LGYNLNPIGGQFSRLFPDHRRIGGLPLPQSLQLLKMLRRLNNPDHIPSIIVHITRSYVLQMGRNSILMLFRFGFRYPINRRSCGTARNSFLSGTIHFDPLTQLGIKEEQVKYPQPCHCTFTLTIPRSGKCHFSLSRLTANRQLCSKCAIIGPL